MGAYENDLKFKSRRAPFRGAQFHPAKEIKMFTNRLFYVLVVLALIIVTSCAPQVAATPNASSAPGATSAQDEPITLRLAVADPEGGRSEPYVLEFIQQVKSLSKGNITIEPVWEAAGSWSTGDPMNAYFEFGVIQLVREGKFGLGLAGSRAFDIHRITSFQALQTPFLIDNDALAKAVATSDIATRMLDDLSSSGMIGVTLWPEDLRHPFSLIPDKPILVSEDFTGLKVRAIPSDVTYALIETLGGNARLSDSNYQAAESGLRSGASLTGAPTATGNVTFFAKYQVLFANGDVFEKLSEAQRTVLREAAATTQQKAIAEHPSEVDAANAWCADGGSIVMASEEQVAAFEAVAQPVFEKIEQDPLNAELIAAIRELKAKTTPAPGAEACAPDAPSQGAAPSSDSQKWATGLPPNGVWQVELTTDDIVQMGVLQSKAITWAGVYTWTFQDGKAQNQYRGTAGTDYSCQSDLTLVEDVVRVTYTSGSDCKDEVDDIQWRLDDAGLHLHLVAIKNAPFVENKAYLEAKPWQKVADQ